MNSQNSHSPAERRRTLVVPFLAALGSCLIVGLLAWFLYSRTRPATLNLARIDERIKFRREIEVAGATVLNDFGWQDQSKGLVRLPITNAMDLLVREWQSPAVGRSNLLVRLDKANPPPPPKAPEKPSAFE